MESLIIPVARVRDTLTQRKVRVAPRTTGSRKALTLYVCGVTPYDSGHMGHAFTFSMFDVLVRLLESGGTRVRYCNTYQCLRLNGGDGWALTFRR